MDAFVTFVALLCGIVSTANANSRVERHQTAVTSWNGLEDFYDRTKREIPFTYVVKEQLHDEDYAGVIRYESYSARNSTLEKWPAPTKALQEQDFEDKNTICARIFNSAFFEMRGEEASIPSVDGANGGVGDRLRLYNRDIYDQLYPPSPPENGLSWLNPYRVLTVTAGDRKYEEPLFVCVTRKKVYLQQTFSPFIYKKYFISPVYQFDDLALNGRFVFSEDLKLFASAEEAATQDLQVVEVTRSTYYKERALQIPDGVTTNILRTLSKEDKLRLCAVVMTAFADKVEFQPAEENVESDCTEREMHGGELVSVSSSMEAKGEEVRYKDFTIGCKVKILSTGERSTFHLTRGLVEFTVVVWHPSVKDADLYIPVGGVRDVRLVKGRGTIPPVRVITKT